MCLIDRGKIRMMLKSDKSFISLGLEGFVIINCCCLLKMLRIIRILFFLVILGLKRVKKRKVNNGESDRKIKCGLIKGRIL